MTPRARRSDRRRARPAGSAPGTCRASVGASDGRRCPPLVSAGGAFGCETRAAMEFTCADLADAIGGQLAGEDVVVSGASIDSRTIGPGQLFVPIVAERDGHDFIPDAVAAGAAAVLVSDPARLPEVP